MTSFSVEILLQEQGAWDFPGGPVVRIPSCHCCDLGSIPAWGTEILQAAWATKKEKGKNRGRNGPAWSREGPLSVPSLLHHPVILASEERLKKHRGLCLWDIFLLWYQRVKAEDRKKERMRGICYPFSRQWTLKVASTSVPLSIRLQSMWGCRYLLQILISILWG